MRKIYFILLNLSIALALCFLTFAVLDWYNPLMGFTTNSFSAKLLVLLCLSTIASSSITLHGALRNRNNQKREMRSEHE